MLFSLDKLPSNILCSKPYQSQNNNATESGEEGKAIHIYEQPPTLISDQQQQIEEGLVLMTQKGVYPSEYTDFFERFQTRLL